MGIATYTVFARDQWIGLQQFEAPLVSVLEVCYVSEERQQIEVAGSQISATHNACYCFRMDGMCSEEQTGHCWTHRNTRLRKHLPGHTYHQARGETVQQDVHQMVTPRLKAAEKMIQPEGHDAQRTIGAVRSGIAEWSAPEVILQQTHP